MYFPNLPLTLLLLLPATLCVPLPAAAAENPELLSLTAGTFKPTTEHGVWLIEHFSPWCPHCRDFAPTWEKLVDRVATANVNVGLAQVNCAVDGDLCNANKVTGYPELKIYAEGVLVDTFKGARDLDRLMKYVTDHAPKAAVASAAPSTEVSAGTTATSSPVEPTTTAAAAPIQPSTPLVRETTPKTHNFNTGTVLELTDATFESTLDQGPTFVKFFAPWCGHCKKLAPKWSQLARHMAHPTSPIDSDVTIAEVNCDAQSAVCKKEGVEGYPMLVYYPSANRKDRTEYTGGRTTDQLQAFIEKATAPAVQVIQAADFDTHLAQNEVLYLLVHSTDAQSHIMPQLTAAARPLLGSPRVYTSSDPALLKRFAHHLPTSSHQPQWAILAIKDHDAETVRPSEMLSSENLQDIHEAALREWLFRNRLPTSTELTQDTFQSVMNAPSTPFVVIVAVKDDSAEKEKIAAKMREIGLKWKIRSTSDGSQAGTRDVVFAWMDAVKWKKWMSSMYGINADSEEPQIVVADHSHLLYYPVEFNGQPIKFTSASIFSVLQDAAANKLKPKHSENPIERFARYTTNRMSLVEAYVSAHPYQLVLGAAGIVVGILLLFKRMLADDGTEDEYQKKGRLD